MGVGYRLFGLRRRYNIIYIYSVIEFQKRFCRFEQIRDWYNILFRLVQIFHYFISFWYKTTI